MNFTPKDLNRYFIVTTITTATCAPGDALLSLRRQLAWEGMESHPEFHATEERQEVRDRVFGVLAGEDFQVDATIFEKRKVQPRIYERGEAHFYQFAWFYHLKYLAKRFPVDTQLLVVPATLGERKRKQEAFSGAVRRVVSQVGSVTDARCAFWRARTDPCLWVADYCSWAIQRKWESTWQGRPDDRSHALIADKIRSEFNILQRGTATYY